MVEMDVSKRDKSKVVTLDELGLDDRNRYWLVWSTFIVSGLIILIYNLVNNYGTSVELVGKSLPGSFLIHNWHNLLVEKNSSYTETLIKMLHERTNKSSGCYEVQTKKIRLEGLPDPVRGEVFFPTDVLHHLTLVAYGEDGQKKCAGGDYFEADFHDKNNEKYRSRLPTTDFGNGSYGLELIVPSRFAGRFVLDVRLLFSNWHGMDFSPGKRHGEDVYEDLIFTQELQMGGEGHPRKVRGRHDAPKSLIQCTHNDFDRTTWQGRWTRGWFNDSCAPDFEKRFRCLPEEHFRCEEPWCFGPVGSLESNGWSYSAHCSFKIFEREEAWKCLDGKWWLVWGDSNVQDTIRNLLLFVLEWDLPPGQSLSDFQLPRSYEGGFINPRSYDQQFRVSEIFNGANLDVMNFEGLHTLTYELHQQKILSHFNGTNWPDTIYMNSGLHDSYRFRTIEEYVNALKFTIQWWMQLYDSIPANRKPQLIWRTTVAPAGHSKRWNSNANKMEMYNLVTVEMFQKVRDRLPVKLVDGFDLTFPWHYSNEYSDGGHYGRAPGVDLAPWHRKPHWYFVDLMLVHILLNIVCPS